ncbi:transmembrane domain-containing protein TMIGD3-like [Protopterus annectens]|uniref:transmembrane domain-containing protein TMIGD3-like n=1 Tax=Protopterus annectens TaxID=7888 RepID=UPI001CFA1843|nr:transmembrane domain-containing protein TMIGD3-like [Protopterus annectens]
MKSLWILVLTLFSGSQSITVEKSIQGYIGQTMEISCVYGPAYKNYAKYWCKGYYRISCSILVETPNSNSADNGRIIITDNELIAKVVIKPLSLEDAGWYWCGIEITGSDIMDYTEMKVSEKTSEDSHSEGIIIGTGIAGGLLLLGLFVAIMMRRRIKQHTLPDKIQLSSKEQTRINFKNDNNKNSKDMSSDIQTTDQKQKEVIYMEAVLKPTTNTVNQEIFSSQSVEYSDIKF